MAIEATVIPQGVPEVGAEITANTFEQIGTPRVFVPTNNITIQSGETMQVDGTLLINGSLVGGGLPQPNQPTSLPSLNDVNVSSLEVGQALKWNGTSWTNLSDEKGLEEIAIDSLNGVQISSPASGQVLKFDGTRWTNLNDESGAGNFSQLTDTNIQSIEQGQIIQWDGNNWVNATQNLVTSLGELTDTNITSPSDLSTLQYDGVSQKWNAVAQTDFVDSIIDAGYSDADLHYVSGFDLDGGFA
jgi:hypothetical protein